MLFKEIPMDNFIFENRSRYNFDETIEKLSKQIVAYDWKNPYTHDLQLTLRNYGKDVLAVKVFEICHPRLSGQLLEKDNERIVSSLMPCRISVYEKSDGNTYISRLNSGMMSAMMGGLIAKVMQEATQEVEKIIAPIVSQE